jgi:hypothetical protein
MVINEGAYGLPDKTKVKIEQPETGDKKPHPVERKKSTGKADD